MCFFALLNRNFDEATARSPFTMLFTDLGSPRKMKNRAQADHFRIRQTIFHLETAWPIRKTKFGDVLVRTRKTERDGERDFVTLRERKNSSISIWSTAIMIANNTLGKKVKFLKMIRQKLCGSIAGKQEQSGRGQNRKQTLKSASKYDVLAFFCKPVKVFRTLFARVELERWQITNNDRRMDYLSFWLTG